MVPLRLGTPRRCLQLPLEVRILVQVEGGERRGDVWEALGKLVRIGVWKLSVEGLLGIEVELGGRERRGALHQTLSLMRQSLAASKPSRLVGPFNVTLTLVTF
mmetsp:Transcript_65550/g.137037  ORF Transcript_65550/g.137037 Transcript_65550/m.137037 type:complete len:103 (-) Transcript_65550:45-353(-)